MFGLLAPSTVDEVLSEFRKAIKRLENISLYQQKVEANAKQEIVALQEVVDAAAAESDRAYRVAKKLSQLIEA